MLKISNERRITIENNDNDGIEASEWRKRCGWYVAYYWRRGGIRHYMAIYEKACAQLKLSDACLYVSGVVMKSEQG